MNGTISFLFGVSKVLTVAYMLLDFGQCVRLVTPFSLILKLRQID